MTDRSIRVLTPAEVAVLVDWARLEGWNPGLHDAAAFQPADPEGFLGAFIAGEMVAGISAVAYGKDYGFLGLYICRPQWRGEGHGRAVWDAGMARLAGRTIGLDAVPAQQANYARMGFVAAYRTERFTGRLGNAFRQDGLRIATPTSAADIAVVDRRVFPAERPAFLQHWIAAPHVALAATDGDAVTGYGVVRQAMDGWRVGPLTARSVDDAAALLAALSAASGDAIIHLDVPAEASAFAERLRDAGFTTSFETTRMYRGPAPDLSAPERLFAITTLELG